MLNKKAAMFGLDARIALAIFGALSIISGASLYSAIQNAKATAFITWSSEVIKSFESLFIDTGSLRIYTGDTSSKMYNTIDLFEDNSVIGWNGPYISGNGKMVVESSKTNYYIENENIPDNFNLRVRNYRNSDWSPDQNFTTHVVCSSQSQQCSLWLQYNSSSKSDGFGEYLEENFDDGVYNTGNIRFATGSTYTSICIKGFIVNNN